MKLTEKKGGDFTPHPETDGQVRAVIVDVTPLKMQQSQFGEREVFRLVYESEVTDDAGANICIWSRPYTCSLNEKSNFRKDCEKLMGRKFTTLELEEGFDPDSLIGKGVSLIITHEHKDDKTYAQIAFIAPDKKGAIKASGKYVRAKDRPEKSTGTGEAAAYRKAPAAAAEESRAGWQKQRVHVGKHAGVDLGDLSEEAVVSLIEKWLPVHAANAKPKADDKRLAAALTEVGELLGLIEPPAAAAEPAAAEADY